MHTALAHKKDTVKRETPTWIKKYDLTNYTLAHFVGWVLGKSGLPWLDCGKWMNDGCLNIKKHLGILTLDGLNLTGKKFRRTFQKCCYRAACSTCFEKWVYREANRATHKIETYAKKMHRKPVHIVIAPSPKHFSKFETHFEHMRKKAYNILKSGLAKDSELAGCMVFHPFRLNKTTKEWYPSPHFHAVGFGWFDADKVRKMHKDEQWIIRNKGVRKSVYGTLQYLLSHAGIKKGKHSVTWFGGLSYSSIAKYNPECKPEPERKHFCPSCDEPLRPIKWIGPGPPPEGEFEGFDDAENWVYA